MLNDAADIENVYIACGYTDLRYGIDGLATLVRNKFDLDPFRTNTLFLFCGRKKDRLRGLLWEGDGFLLLYKRLESGKFRWPRNACEVRKMTPQQYRWLMEGLTIEPQKLDLLLEQIRISNQARFGHSSEKVELQNQLAFCFNEAEVTVADADEIAEPTIEQMITEHKRRVKKKGKRSEDLSAFPVRIETHVIPEEKLKELFGGD